MNPFVLLTVSVQGCREGHAGHWGDFVSADGVSCCVTPPTGMLSWWPREGDALDLVGTNDRVCSALSRAGARMGASG